MLEHVRREEVLLTDRVQRGDEGESRDGDSGREESGSIPAGVVVPPPAPKPDESLAEESERDRRPDEHRRRRSPGRPELGPRDAVAVTHGGRRAGGNP